MSVTRRLACLLGLGLGMLAHADPAIRDAFETQPEPGSGGGLLQTNVIGEDGRRAADDTETDLLKAVGMVVCASAADGRRQRAFGTGTVVGNRRTILTAAHVLTDDGGRSGQRVRFDVAADCTFRQYDSRGELIVEAAFRDATYGAFRWNSGAPNEDWAVLRTREPLPATTEALPFAALGFDGLSARTRLPIAALAFHADLRRRSDQSRPDQRRRRIPLLSEGMLFPVRYAGFERLAHTADMGRMSSGAAIVHRTDDGRNIVVGIHKSAATLGDFNLAVPLSAALAETLKSQVWGQAPDFRERLARLR